MAATIGAINQKLDLALSKLQGIDDLKVTEYKRSWERKNRVNRKSPLCAQRNCWAKGNFQIPRGTVIDALEMGVNAGFAERYQNGEGTCYQARRPQPKDQFEIFRYPRSRGWIFCKIVALHTAGAREIRINQSRFSRRGKLYFPDVNAS